MGKVRKPFVKIGYSWKFSIFWYNNRGFKNREVHRLLWGNHWQNNAFEDFETRVPEIGNKKQTESCKRSS